MVDTASLIERRRQILLNTPHLTTASANPLTFQTDILANLKDCKIYFEPVQEGSGDPSPDNVRPISGWDWVELHVNNNTLTLPFPKTIYGGYVDLVKGEVVETVGSDGQPITPQTYAITPQTIKTLKGINNIWSDANGNIEVKFWKH